MHVVIYQLRRNGDRLSPADVLGQAGIEGQLRLSREPGDRVGEWHGHLALRTADAGILELHDARLTRLDSRGMVFAGEERHWARKVCRRVRQGWWVLPRADLRAETGVSENHPPSGRPLAHSS